jgi:integrase
MVTGQLKVSAELFGRVDLWLGNAARIFCPAAHAWFAHSCARLGTGPDDIGLQWNTLVKVTAMTGTAPDRITELEFERARVALIGVFAGRGMPASGRNLASIFHRLRLTLFHSGRLDTFRHPTRHAPVSVTGWAMVTPGFADTARRYVAQVTLSLRPSSIKHIEHDLREFGTWLTLRHADVASCADLDRHHIEVYKTWLVTTPRNSAGGKPLNRVSVKNALINLHCFFDRITDWGYPNPPQRPLVFAGDLPIVDKPLPRFLDDAAAAKLLRTARQDVDPLARLVTELLARTGIRRGELLDLTVDAVVQIGSAYWLRIPLGKLHNDRYIPLHPQLKELLDDWIANHRSTDVRSNRLLIERNRPVTAPSCCQDPPPTGCRCWHWTRHGPPASAHTGHPVHQSRYEPRRRRRTARP